jgi:hypothetical protein
MAWKTAHAQRSIKTPISQHSAVVGMAVAPVLPLSYPAAAGVATLTLMSESSGNRWTISSYFEV